NHVHRKYLVLRIGVFHAKPEGNLFMRLDGQNQDIRLQDIACSAEEFHRKMFKLQAYLGYSSGQALAGAEIKRHAGPPEIVYIEFSRKKSRGVRSSVNLILGTVARDLAAVQCPPAILPSHYIIINIVCVHRMDRPEYF